MRLFPSTFRSAFLRAALVLAAAGLLGACDRHSAEEVPENYGHGSSHDRGVSNHQADSSKKDHFSDTMGLKEEAREGNEAHGTPAPSVSSKGF